jgi:N-terminal or F0 domain of Talin-head FERM
MANSITLNVLFACQIKILVSFKYSNSLFIVWIGIERVCFLRISAKDYGLFLADEDAKMGVWLEPGRSLNYYILKGGVRDKAQLVASS